MGRSISWRFHRYIAYGPHRAYGPGPAEGPGQNSDKGEGSPARPTKEEIEVIVARYVKPEQQRR